MVVRGTRHGDQLAPAPEIQKNYGFPRMPFSEILEDMAEYGHPIAREVIKAPTTADVTQFFEFFIYLIYNISKDDMSQPSFGCLDVLAYPELHEASVPILHFSRQCQEMFTASHFDAFTIRDLSAPEKSRFHWQISALLNFAKFRQTRQQAFQELSQNEEDLAVAQSNLVAQTAEVTSEIATIEDARAEKEPEVEKLKEEMAGMKLEFTDLYKQQIAISDEIRELKTAFTKKTEQFESHKVANMTLSEEVDLHRSRVCSSPDRVKGEIEDMRETLALEKENVVGTGRRTHAMRSRTMAISVGLSKVANLVKTLEEALAEDERVKALGAENETKRTRNANLDAEFERLSSLKAHLERQLDSKEQNLTRIGQMATEKYKEASDEMRAHSEKRKEVQAEQLQTDLAIEEKNRTATQIQQQIESCAVAFAAELEQLTQAQSLLNEKLSHYHTDIVKCTDIISTATSGTLEAYREEIAKNAERFVV